MRINHLLPTALFAHAYIISCVMHVCMVSTFNRVEYGSTRYCCQGQLNRKPVFFPSQFAPEILASQDGFGRPVPSRAVPCRLAPARSLSTSRQYLVLTHRIPPVFRDGIHLSRRPPSGQSQVDQVTQLRAEGVHCRESDDDLKVVRVRGLPI